MKNVIVFCDQCLGFFVCGIYNLNGLTISFLMLESLVPVNIVLNYGSNNPKFIANTQLWHCGRKLLNFDNVATIITHR